MTPTLARMVAQKAGELILPIKWFTFGRRFRYEKPQKGRGREFYQWDIDILGLNTPEADAEIIATAASFYRNVGLTPQEVIIKINDRQLLQEKILSLGIEQKDMIKAFRLLDKKDKVSQQDFIEMAKELCFSEDQALAMIQITEEKEAYQNSEWLMQVFDLVKKYGVADFVEYDPSIVRGIEYYTRTVFEGWDVKREFRSIWGGGRYDNLTVDVGGKQKIPGVGFAMGDKVIAEILKANNKYPALSVNKTKILVTVFSPDFYEKSQELVTSLRYSNKVNAEFFLDPLVKLDKQIKYADKKGIPFVAIIGPDEAKNNTVTIKDLKTGTQKTVPLQNLSSYV